MVDEGTDCFKCEAVAVKSHTQSLQLIQSFTAISCTPALFTLSVLNIIGLGCSQAVGVSIGVKIIVTTQA